MYRTIDAAFWTDHKGKEWATPKCTRKILCTPKVNSHAAVRAFVFHRDKFECQKCGARLENPPQDYDGKYALVTENTVLLVLDHILSIAMGGTHHPLNLQVLCDPCNARKSRTLEGSGSKRHA